MTATVNRSSGFDDWHQRLRNGFQPRDWQTEAINALHEYIRLEQFSHSFTAKVDPGFGKTLFAALAIKTLADAGLTDWGIVLVPNQNLVDQTIADAPLIGIQLCDAAKGVDRSALRRQGYCGEVLTYSMLLANQQVYADQARHHGSRMVLVKDEAHRLADGESSDDSKAWSAALDATLMPYVPYRITMTGTLFRSDEYGISDVPYGPADEEGVREVIPHFKTRMVDGITNNWVRRLVFHTQAGRVQWLEGRGDNISERAADLSDSNLRRQDRSTALATALDVRLPYAQEMLRQGFAELQVRRRVTPDAAMIVICKDKYHAKDVRDWLQEELSITVPLVLGEDGSSGQAIKDFKQESPHNHQVIVAVKMISEGCSIKRLQVGVLLTNITTRLNFLQTGARCNRNRSGRRESATWFIPALPQFLTYALEYEQDVLHLLKEKKEKTGGVDGPGPSALCGICEDPSSADFTGQCPGPGVEPCPLAPERKVYRLDSEAGDQTVIAGGADYEREFWEATREMAAAEQADPELVARLLRRAGFQPGQQATAQPVENFMDQLQSLKEEYRNRAGTICSLLLDRGWKWDAGDILKAINSTAIQLGFDRHDTKDVAAMRRKVAWVKDTERCLADVSSYMGGQR